MTLREFFLKTVDSEQPIFERVLRAVNQSRWDYQPDPKTKKAKDIANLIAAEPGQLAELIRTGAFNFSEPPEPKSVDDLVQRLNSGFAAVKSATAGVDDQTWETREIAMQFPGGEW